MIPTQAPFPTTRFRRLRSSAALRALSRQNTLLVDDLIWPVFVRDGEGVREPVASMPGVDRLSIDVLVDEAAKAHALGIPAIFFANSSPGILPMLARISLLTHT